MKMAIDNNDADDINSDYNNCNVLPTSIMLLSNSQKQTYIEISMYA